MSSNVTPLTPAPTPILAPTTTTTPSIWTTVARRLGEASTWAGIGGILLVVLNLLPAALPGFHAALGQHGWAKTTGLLIALLSFVVAVAKKEGNTTVAELAEAAEIVVEAERSRAPGVCV